MPLAPPIVETVDPGIAAAWYALFLATFPEFSNVALYPAALVESWFLPAADQLNADRLGAQYNLAVCLLVAHNIVLSARETKAAAGSGVVGESYGPIVSKSIDKLSVSYGSTTATEGAGAYNLTVYGQRLYRLIQTYGTGPMYVPGPRRNLGLAGGARGWGWGGPYGRIGG